MEYTDKIFNNTPIDFKAVKEFYNCTFKCCSFSSENFSNIIFEDCTFEDCDLSLIVVIETAFRQVHFTGCKMMGIQFDTLRKFNLEMTFEDCNLSMSSFYALNLQTSISFNNCRLHQVNFEKVQFQGGAFYNCDLLGATFSDSDLRKVNFSSAQNIILAPDQNKIKGAIFSKKNALGLLDKYNLKIVE